MTHRIERVNSVIRQEISDMLQRQVKDPRLSQLISVTEVSTTPDMKLARVYISCLCTPEEKKGIIEALGSATGYFHKELIKRLNMRSVPEIHFQWDDSIERGDRLLQLINKVSQDHDASQDG
jgi:ribosome-binding factor A